MRSNPHKLKKLLRLFIVTLHTVETVLARVPARLKQSFRQGSVGTCPTNIIQAGSAELIVRREEESKSGCIAQLVERRAYTSVVPGSSPGASTFGLLRTT